MSFVQSKKSTIKHFFNFAASSVVPAIMVPLGVALFTRLFNTVEYGSYSLAVTSAMFASVTASQWLQQSTTRYIPGIRDSPQIENARAAILAAILGIIGIVTIGTLLLSLLNCSNAKWKGLLLPTSAMAVSGSVCGPLITLLQCELKSGKIAICRILNSSASIIMPLAMYIFWGAHARSLMWGAFVASLVTSAVAWKWAEMPPVSVLYSKYLEILPIIKKFALYGAPMTGWFFLSNMLFFTDRYIIQVHRGEIEVGVYSASYILMNGVATLIAGPLVMLVHPILMRAWDKGNVEEAAEWIGSISELLLIADVFLFALVYIFSGELSSLMLGKSFQGGRATMPIIFFAGAMWQTAMYAHKPFEFLGNIKMMLILLGCVVLFSIIANLYFVPKFGYYASSVVWLCSAILYQILAVFFGRKIVRWSISANPLIMGICFSALLVVTATELHGPMCNYFGYLLGNIVLLILVLIVAAASFIFVEGRNIRKLWCNESIHTHVVTP